MVQLNPSRRQLRTEPPSGLVTDESTSHHPCTICLSRVLRRRDETNVTDRVLEFIEAGHSHG